MKITDLKPGQKVKIFRKDYTYEGIKKVPAKIGKVQKIVFQGEEKNDQILYNLSEGALTLENENIQMLWPQ